MVFVSRLLACGKSASHVFGNSLPVRDPSLFSCYMLNKKSSKVARSFGLYQKNTSTGNYVLDKTENNSAAEVNKELVLGSGHHNVGFSFENDEGKRCVCFLGKLTSSDHVGDRATIPVAVSNNGELYGNFYHLNDTQSKQFLALYSGKIIVMTEETFLEEFKPEFDNKNGLSADQIQRVLFEPRYNSEGVIVDTIGGGIVSKSFDHMDGLYVETKIIASLTAENKSKFLLEQAEKSKQDSANPAAYFKKMKDAISSNSDVIK